MMNSIVSAVLGGIFALSMHYSIEKLSQETKVTTLKRIKKGFSSSEDLAQKLTGIQLDF